MTRKGRRLLVIGSSLAVLAVAATLVLVALSGTIVFFHSPGDVAEKAIAPGTRFRLGGLVQPGSVERGDDMQVRFGISDGRATLPVSYTGLLPDLFREGQGIVTEGVLQASGVFRADSVLAKHDENYMPREVADALKKDGRWQGETSSRVVAQ